MKLTTWRSKWPLKQPSVYIGVDPGETTGVAVWRRGFSEDVELLELKPEAFKTYMRPWLQSKGAYIFSERFDIADETVRVSPPVDSLYINGWLAIESMPKQFTEIGRADSKGFTSNAQLRHYGWWKVGSKDHCRDAARILAYAMAHFDEPWLLDKMQSYIEELKAKR